MDNLEKHIGEVKAKHGVFSFCHFDEYIGLSLREYGEFSEIELSLMSIFIMIDEDHNNTIEVSEYNDFLSCINETPDPTVTTMNQTNFIR